MSFKDIFSTNNLRKLVTDPSLRIVVSVNSLRKDFKNVIESFKLTVSVRFLKDISFITESDNEDDSVNGLAIDVISVSDKVIDSENDLKDVNPLE